MIPLLYIYIFIYASIWRCYNYLKQKLTPVGHTAHCPSSPPGCTESVTFAPSMRPCSMAFWLCFLASMYDCNSLAGQKLALLLRPRKHIVTTMSL